MTKKDDDQSSENVGPIMLVMNAEQAALVRYRTPGQSGLDPVALADGATFVLPVSVIDDPAHAAQRDILSKLEKRRVSKREWPKATERA